MIKSTNDLDTVDEGQGNLAVFNLLKCVPSFIFIIPLVNLLSQMYLEIE